MITFYVLCKHQFCIDTGRKGKHPYLSLWLRLNKYLGLVNVNVNKFIILVSLNVKLKDLFHTIRLGLVRTYLHEGMGIGLNFFYNTMFRRNNNVSEKFVENIWGLCRQIIGLIRTLYLN